MKNLLILLILASIAAEAKETTTKMEVSVIVTDYCMQLTEQQLEQNKDKNIYLRQCYEIRKIKPTDSRVENGILEIKF